MRIKPIVLVLVFLLFDYSHLFSQTDSVVKVSDLTFHSELEKEAFFNAIHNKGEIFYLYASIDPELTREEIDNLYQIFQSVYADFENRKLSEKKINKQIKLAYSIAHEKFLDRYVEAEYFPSAFISGRYNCVSASMLYSMIYDHLGIPYKVMASTNHVYLVANPGKQSVVIETTNPTFANQIFNGEFKRNFVLHLRDSKMISENELKTKSVDELFEAHFKKVREVSPSDLPGMQYYNKALVEFEKGEYERSYELIKKAAFFFKHEYVDYVLTTNVLLLIERSDFEKVEDIDLLCLYSRTKTAEKDVIAGVFNNIINHHLQYSDRAEFCDSIYHRMCDQITDEKLKEEISFTYNMRMSMEYQGEREAEKYILNAISLRPTFKDINRIMEYHFQSYLGNYRNQTDSLLIQVERIKNEIDYECISEIVHYYEMLAYITIAEELFDDNDIRECQEYVRKFEAISVDIVEDYYLERQVARTFRKLALYYKRHGYRTRAKSLVDRGLKHVPDNAFLKSAVY